jgi:hypothetical protein
MDWGNFKEVWTLGHQKTLGMGMLLGQYTVEWTTFEARSKADGRRPTFSIFTESYGDITDASIRYDFKRTLVGGTNMIAEPNYGTGSISIYDENGDYMANGRPVFRRGKKVFIFAGFDNMNIPRFSGLIKNATVQTDRKTIALDIADYGYKYRTAKTGGNLDNYNTPKLLIDYLASLVLSGAVEYENESGRPSNVVFGDTLLETRSFWAMIHGCCLLLGYRQFFDEKGKLQIKTRKAFYDTGYIFRDDDITWIRHSRPVDIINKRIVNLIELLLPFTCGEETVGLGTGTYSRIHSLSKRKYGEYANAETDELIGTAANVQQVVNQDLEFTAFPRDFYEMKIPSLPQLQLADRIFINHAGQNISGFFEVLEIGEDGSQGNLSNVLTLMNDPERF